MKIVFIDIETTGLNPLWHRPVEIAIKVLRYGKVIERFEYESIIKWKKNVWRLADKEALEYNGFTFEDLKDGKDIWMVGKEIEKFLYGLKITNKDSFFLSQNPVFDKMFFQEFIDIERLVQYDLPYHWLDLASMYWNKVYASKMIMPKEVDLSKDAIAKCLGLPLEEKPHRAMKGVNHLIKCYEALCEPELFINMRDD